MSFMILASLSHKNIFIISLHLCIKQMFTLTLYLLSCMPCKCNNRKKFQSLQNHSYKEFLFTLRRRWVVPKQSALWMQPRMREHHSPAIVTTNKVPSVHRECHIKRFFISSTTHQNSCQQQLKKFNMPLLSLCPVFTWFKNPSWVIQSQVLQLCACVSTWH